MTNPINSSIYHIKDFSYTGMTVLNTNSINVNGPDQTKCLQFKGKALEVLQLYVKFDYYIFSSDLLRFISEL